MSVKTDCNRLRERVMIFLSFLNIPDAKEKIDDDVFMRECVFPVANERFLQEYWNYRSVDHYLRNKEFYDNIENHTINPIQ